jgi:hypothetical protein
MPSHGIFLLGESVTMLVIRRFALFAVLLSSSWGAFAAQPSVESIETLLRATRAESLLESVYASAEAVMRQTLAQSVAGKTLTPEQKRFLDSAPTRFVAVMREELSWESLKPMYIQIYQDNFTQDEIDGLITFYRSPTGQAFASKMPAVMQQSMQIMQRRIRPFVEKMKGAVDAAIAESMAEQPPARDTTE